jgi:TetR/AcrR family transcriptional repressor of nem operon
MTPPERRSKATTRPVRGAARDLILAAALRLIREKGFAAASVDDFCAAAGVSKGAFFHHFASKEALGIAAARHWSEMTGAMFVAADYHNHADPVGRVLAYLDLRRNLAIGTAGEYSCVAGTLAQEVHASIPAIREAARDTIRGGADHVRAHLAEAMSIHPVPGVTADSLARHVQAVIQGGIVLAKAEGDPAVLRDSIDHLDRYIRQLFGRA